MRSPSRTGSGQSRADRFLDAFRSIDRQVHLLAGVDDAVSFVAALRTAQEYSPELRRYDRNLRQFAKLRNTIVHEPYVDNDPIADPREDAIRQIEDLADVVLRPPTALSVLKHPVATATPKMPLEEAARVMLDGDFSQLPVVEGGVVTDILTSEAVARYLTAFAFGHLGTTNVAVESVVESDPDRKLQRLSADASALTIVEQFEASEAAGEFLHAVFLIKEEPPELLGIVTLYDLPALLRAARPY